MADQTVSLKLTADADDLKRAVNSSADAMEDLAGKSTDAGRDIEGVLAGIPGSADKAGREIRTLADRLDGLTGTDRDIVIRGDVSQAEKELRKIEGMLEDPTLQRHEIELLLSRHRQVTGQLDDLKGQLGEVEASADEAGRAFDGMGGQLGALGGAAAGLGIASVLDSAEVSSGKLRAQLGLTKEEAQQFDDVAREVYGNNFGDTMEHAAQVTGQVHQSLGLTGDELKATTEGVFAVSDAFGHLGADTDIILEGVRSMTANFPGLDEARALDLVAAGFQSGAGSAGDLQDTLQEYPGDFARMGLTADDMLGILGAGMEAGARNTDIMADAVREMGIRISSAGDTGQQALAKLFPKEEADRLIRDVTAGGEAGREAFYTILDGLTAVQDPQDRYNLAVEIMGTRGEELANILPGMRDALLEVRDGTYEAEGATDSLNEQYVGFRSTLEGLKRQLETSVLAPLGDVGGVAVDAATGIGTFALGMSGLGVTLDGVKTKAAAFGRFLVGPWGIALAGGALALKHLADRAADLDLAGQNLEGHLQDVAAGADGLNDAWLRQEMASAGVLATWDELGIDLDTLRGALMGVPEDIATVEGALNGSRGAWESLSDAAHGLSGGLVGNENDVRELHRVLGALGVEIEDMIPLFEEQERQARNNEVATARLTGQAEHYGAAVGEASDATGIASDAAGDYETAMGDLEGQIEDTRTAQQKYLDDVRAAEDPVFALNQALQGVEDAQQAYTDAVKEYGKKSAEAQAASFDLMGAISNLEAAAIDGDLSFGEFDRRLDLWVDQGRITAGQADNVRRRVQDLTGAAKDYAGNYTATIKAETASSLAAIERVRAALGRIPRFTHTTVVASTDSRASTGRTIERRADGGPVEVDRTYWVGEEGPELVTFGQAGWVHDAATSAQMVPTITAAGHDGARAGTTFQPVTNIYGDVGRETLAEKRHQDRMMYRQIA